eukprot:scaffold42477_cov82-Phaeocystis_antarctica.AAC.3
MRRGSFFCTARRTSASVAAGSMATWKAGSACSSARSSTQLAPRSCLVCFATRCQSTSIQGEAQLVSSRAVRGLLVQGWSPVWHTRVDEAEPLEAVGGAHGVQQDEQPRERDAEAVEHRAVNAVGPAPARSTVIRPARRVPPTREGHRARDNVGDPQRGQQQHDLSVVEGHGRHAAHDEKVRNEQCRHHDAPPAIARAPEEAGRQQLEAHRAHRAQQDVGQVASNRGLDQSFDLRADGDQQREDGEPLPDAGHLVAGDEGGEFALDQGGRGASREAVRQERLFQCAVSQPLVVVEVHGARELRHGHRTPLRVEGGREGVIPHTEGAALPRSGAVLAELR